MVHYFCLNCWNEIDKDVTICPYCGADQKKLDKIEFNEKLIRAIYHPEPETPIRVANILAKLKLKSAIPDLFNRLVNEKDPYIIEAIVEALIEIDIDNKERIKNILSKQIPVTVKKILE